MKKNHTQPDVFTEEFDAEIDNIAEGIVLTMKYFRKRAKLSQQSVADGMLMTQSNYSRLEIGETDITFIKICVFCRVVGIDYVTFFKHYEKIRQFALECRDELISD